MSTANPLAAHRSARSLYRAPHQPYTHQGSSLDIAGWVSDNEDAWEDPENSLQEKKEKKDVNSAFLIE